MGYSTQIRQQQQQQQQQEAIHSQERTIREPYGAVPSVDGSHRAQRMEFCVKKSTILPTNTDVFLDRLGRRGWPCLSYCFLFSML